MIHKTMNAVRILHTADLHLDGAERSAVFSRIQTLAQREKADLLLIAGDLFDQPYPPAVLAETVRSGLSALAENGIQTVIAAGNHDPLTPGSPYTTQWAEIPGVWILGAGQMDCAALTVRGSRICVYGRSMSASHQEDSPLGGFSASEQDGADVRLLVQHGDLAPTSRYAPIRTEELAASGVDYAALGHIHKRSDILCAGKTHYAYCGCPEGRGFDETGPLGVYLGEVWSGGHSLRFEPVCRWEYRIVRLEISRAAAPSALPEFVIEALRQRFGEDYAGHRYRLVLEGSCGFLPDLQLLQAQLSDRLAEVHLRDKTLPPVQEGETVPGLRGSFLRKMQEKLRNASPEQRPLLEAALRAGLRALEGEVKEDDF